MQRDIRGLGVTAASAEAVAAFDHVIEGYLAYRADIPRRMAALEAADPAFGLAQCLKGYLAMLGYKQAALPVARAALAASQRAIAKATAREQAHVSALGAWVDGEPDRAAAIWDGILADHPHDILAFRLAHFVNFWFGRPEAMLASVLAVEKHWGDTLPGYNAILGCRCFAHEECGYYIEAEHSGREAIRRDPGDLWAAHGVAHVLEMTGRRGEGIAWVDGLAEHWTGANNLKHHLWWHGALFHLERGDMARVLAAYDSAFRDLGSPLTEASPDLYIDVQNAASMLFRLGRHGVDVGNRWIEIADKAEQRIGDCLSVFTLPHWMMALAATGRGEAARRMLAGMRDFAAGNGIIARLVGEIGVPLCEAVLAHGQGRFADAVALMRPLLGDLYRLGGSHAQQDVLAQLYLDAALKAGLRDDARLLVERAAGQNPVPPQRRRGYAMALDWLA